MDLILFLFIKFHYFVDNLKEEFKRRVTLWIILMFDKLWIYY